MRLAYTPALAAKICAALSTGKLLRQVCSKSGMPSESSVYLWLSQHPEFAESYARAKELQVDAIAADTLEIADKIRIGKKRKKTVYAKGLESTEEQTGDMVERARLMIETRKWLLSKMAPRRYGDRLELAGELKVDATLTVAETLRRRREARQQAEQPAAEAPAADA